MDKNNNEVSDGVKKIDDLSWEVVWDGGSVKDLIEAYEGLSGDDKRDSFRFLVYGINDVELIIKFYKELPETARGKNFQYLVKEVLPEVLLNFYRELPNDGKAENFQYLVKEVSPEVLFNFYEALPSNFRGVSFDCLVDEVSPEALVKFYEVLPDGFRGDRFKHLVGKVSQEVLLGFYMNLPVDARKPAFDCILKLASGPKEKMSRENLIRAYGVLPNDMKVLYKGRYDEKLEELGLVQGFGVRKSVKDSAANFINRGNNNVQIQKTDVPKQKGGSIKNLVEIFDKDKSEKSKFENKGKDSVPKIVAKKGDSIQARASIFENSK